jgi:hypothetical protein
LKIGLAILHFAMIFYCVYALGKKWNVVFDKLYWCSFLFRLSGGVSLGLIYIYYYSASDTWQFFEDAKKLSAVGRENFSSYLKIFFDLNNNQNLPDLLNNDLRAIFFIKIISSFLLISMDSYWVCAAYFSLLAFISSWVLHREIVSRYPNSFRASALAFLIFPSVIFWSSGLEKESIALCGIYFLASVFLKIMVNEKLNKFIWLLVIVACFIVWSLKYYWAIIFFVSVFTALSIRFMSSRVLIVMKYQIVAWVMLFITIGMALSFAHPNFYISRLLEVIISNYNDFALISDPKNLIHYFQFEQTWISMVINSPWALFSGLFRPVIGQGQGILGWMASIENFFLFVLFLGSMLNIRKGFAHSKEIIFLAMLSYCVVLSIFLALSTPNLGTLSRYRVGFLPFFVFIISYRNPLIEWICNKVRWKAL